MVVLGDKPILEHNILRLVRFGFTEIGINLHISPESVTRHFGDGSRFGIKIEYFAEEEPLGTAGALVNAKRYLSGDSFLVVYGDNIATVDFDTLRRAHLANDGIATVVLFERKDTSASGVAELDEDNVVTRFIEKPAAGESRSHLVSAGVVYCDPDVINMIPDIQSPDISRHLFPPLVEARSLCGYVTTDPVLWADTTTDLEWARAAISRIDLSR
jgi:NDP-sugar pyrophosphorylase family protein